MLAHRPPTAGDGRAAWRDESGAVSAEQVAIISVVAAVIAALLAIPIAPIVGAWGEYAVCVLFGDDDCARPGSDGRTDRDYRPENCDIIATTYDGSVGADVLIFDVETGVSYARTDRSDGTTSFTVVSTDGAGVGVESPGVEAQAGPVSIDIGAEAGVGVEVEEGQTWIVPTDQADDLQGLLLRDLAHDQSVGRIPLVGWATGWVKDRVFGEAPDPDVTFIAGGVNAYAEASAEAAFGGQTIAGGNVGVEGAVMLGIEQNRAGSESEWRDTEYLQLSAGVTGELGIATVGVGGELEATHILKVERDMDRRITSIEIVDSVAGTSLGDIGSRLTDTSSVLAGGENSSVVETVSIPVDTAEDREVVAAWLRGQDDGSFADLATREAIVTIEERAGDDIGLDLGAKVAFGVKLGLSGSGSRATSEIVDIYYLGAPDTTGARTPVQFTECLEAAG